MPYITLNLRLRPIRFAFLVNPNNSQQLLEVFRVNTCLWGGKFNPIIPIHKDSAGHLSEKEKQIAKKYLDFFEPDFVVETEEGISEGLNCKRTLDISQILANEPEEMGDKVTYYGQNVKSLYETEFESNSSSMRKNIHVRAEDDQFKNFVACNFGDFPEEERLKHFRKSYERCFSPSYQTFGLNTPDLVYSPDYQSPLDMNYFNNYSENKAAFFLLDVKDNRDLIDFWNLRGIYQNIKAVPIQCLTKFSPYLSEFEKKYYPAPESNKIIFVPFRPGNSVPIFSSSISQKIAEKFYKQYIQCNPNKDMRSYWNNYPYWKSATEFFKNEYPPILEAKRKKIDIELNEKNHEVNLDLLCPEPKESGGIFLWANIITIQDLNHQIATVFPYNYKENFISLNIVKEKFDNYLESSIWDYHPKNYPSDERIKKELLSTSEGLVVFSHCKRFSERLILMDGINLIKNWVQSHKKVKASNLSDAGRTTQQIIQLLDFEGISSIATKNTIELLNEMSNKQFKSFQFKEFHNKFDQDIKTESSKNSVAKILIKNKVVKLGMEIECDKCKKFSWYSLEKLNYSLVCDFCLESYPFPVFKPNQIKWSYRVIGPFALSNYAGGGYATALSVRFFTNIIGRYWARIMYHGEPYYYDSPKKSDLDDKVTWSPGQELELTSEEKIEADFILQTQRWDKGRIEYLNTIFGEAKSFGKFEETDVDRMKKLAEMFPGSLLVFATMKDFSEFSDPEITRIKKLAEWEREKRRLLVIILTGTELFARSSLSTAWDEKIKELEKKGNNEQAKKYREVNRLLIHDDNYLNPVTLGFMTQYLYLDIPLDKSPSLFSFLQI